MVKVLIVEDDPLIQELIRFNLEKEKYRVFAAENGRQGLELAIGEKPDVVILDLMLPELDGYEVCKAIRTSAELSKIPVIILSARNDVTDKIIGLELGADDYMVKPFSPKELISRIKARIREQQRHRSSENINEVIAWGELVVAPANFMISLSGSALTLTAKEFELANILLTHPNQVFSREHLLQKIWGYDAGGDTRTVDVHISNLRQKFKAYGKCIETVRGVGYRFNPGISKKDFTNT